MSLTLLDLCCNAGGCSVGYARAGFDVTGVDHLPMPRYPFMSVLQADVLDVLGDAAFVRGFDVIHASPPCQAYTTLHSTCRPPCRHPRLIEPIRDRLRQLGVPYVIENVAGAPLVDPVELCGSMFGLGVYGMTLRRHRLFESNVPLTAPGPHACAGVPIVGVYGNGGAWTRTAPGGGGTKVGGADAAAALGVTWTTHQDNLREMVPPSYTEHLGAQLRAYVEARAA